MSSPQLPNGGSEGTQVNSHMKKGKPPSLWLDGVKGVADGDESSRFSASESQAIGGIGPTPDCRRWFVLLAFFLLAANSAQQWICYAPIVVQARDFFSMNAFQVDTMSQTYLIMYPFIAPFTCFSFQRFGFKKTLCIGAFFNLLAAVVRLCAVFWFPSYAAILVAQLIASLGQFSILSTPAVLAEEWFPSSQRTIANTVCFNSLNCGIATGLLIPPLIVTPTNHGTTAFATVYGAYLGSIALLAFICCCCVPDEPREPMSPTRKAEAEDPTSVKEIVKLSKEALVGSTAFKLLNIAVGVGVGAMWAFSTVYTQIFLPFGITEQQSGLMGFINIAVGSVFAVCMSALVDRYKKYKEPLLAGMTTVAFCQGAMLLVLIYITGGKTLLAVVFALYTLIGMAQAIVGGLGMELGAEVTFPVPASVSAGLLMGSASAISLVLTLSAAALLGDDPTKHDAALALVVFILISSIAAATVIPIRSELKRLVHEDSIRSPLLVSSAGGGGGGPQQYDGASVMSPNSIMAQHRNGTPAVDVEEEQKPQRPHSPLSLRTED